VPGRRAIRPVFCRTAAPVQTPDGVTFPAASGVPGRCWSGTGCAPLVLFEDETTRVEWEEVVGCGSVTGAGLPPQARGYAERLHMVGWPWRLGLSRPLWGRFCGSRHSLVWIVWEGRLNKSWCFLDGKLLRGMNVALPGLIQAEGVRLDMQLQSGLVDEPIRGALGGLRLPGPAGRFLAGRERKCTAPARLSGEFKDHGQVIHEVVEWA